MSDKFLPLTMEQLARWVFEELEGKGSIFGLPRELFFSPKADDRFRTAVYGQPLETPFGVAAGPHSQMAQNIIAAWLCGGRFIELKTVQTLDELDVSKPCIDMRDVGYNVEWSQELKIDQSIEEYLRAWVLVHVLHRKLGFPGERPGIVFNMSVGYDLAGITKPNVQRFLGRMGEAGDRLGELVEEVARFCPEARDVAVPAKVSDNVTVSTMHGCPPEEIGKICRYLMEEWHFQTSVKLNPTLLGKERVRYILNEALGYRDIVVPDIAFEHDLKYPDALELLGDLLAASTETGVAFGVKLCNTLEVSNHREVFAPDQKMMYMSGRAHHAVAVNVAHKLGEDVGGRLEMSFSGGADAWNVPELLASGMRTVTTCSDILRPGGYGRLLQYVAGTREALDRAGASDLESYVVSRAKDHGEASDEPGHCARANLARYAAAVLTEPALMKPTFDRERTSTSRALGPFDCIEAPCADTCPIGQRVPEYMRLVAAGKAEEAARVIRADNAMAAVLGRACTHTCELVCVRAHYDEPVAIREIKRFAMDHEGEREIRRSELDRRVGVAVVGGGPTALAVASELAPAGYEVTVLEARPELGGMVTASIPAYRSTQKCVDQDLGILDELGVTVKTGTRVGVDLELVDLLRAHDFVVLGAGAQCGLPLGIEGEESEGVLDGLDFLRLARLGEAPSLGARVGIIGGGDVAMDCARTAKRLAGGGVSIVYRRTKDQMPAGKEELEELLEEGIDIQELLSPRRVLASDGRMSGLECSRMRLGKPDDSGRRRPEEIPGEVVTVPLDTLIVAIGQRADTSFLGDVELEVNQQGFVKVDPDSFETSHPGLYAGGDLIDHGPDTIVRALGDGRAIAGHIRHRTEGSAEDGASWPEVSVSALVALRSARARRVEIPHRSADDRSGFDEVVGTLSAEAARLEAGRCLSCDELCSICASVCPNRAIQTYEVEPFEVELPELRLTAAGVEIGPACLFRVAQPYQVAVLTDFCNECGNCATFCPTAGRPYADKPRLYLHHEELEQETSNAFMILRKGGQWSIEARHGGQTHELTLGETIRYESPRATANFRPEPFGLLSAGLGASAISGEGTVSLEIAAQMYALLRGIRKSLPHLPFAE